MDTDQGGTMINPHDLQVMSPSLKGLNGEGATSSQALPSTFQPLIQQSATMMQPQAPPSLMVTPQSKVQIFIQTINHGGPMNTSRTSPDKTVLLTECMQLKRVLEETRIQEEQGIQFRQRQFEFAAQQFQVEARDVTRAEVAQVEAKTRAGYISTLQDASQRLLQEREMVAIVEQNAESAVQQQKAEVVSQAKYAIDMTHQQKDAVVQEAEDMLSQKSSTIHYLERRFEEAQFCYTQAEGNFKQEISTAEGNFMQMQGDILTEQRYMETRYAEEHNAALQHIQAMAQREGQLQTQYTEKNHILYQCEILNSQLKIALLQSEQTTEKVEAQATLSIGDRFSGLEDEL